MGIISANTKFKFNRTVVVSAYETAVLALRYSGIRSSRARAALPRAAGITMMRKQVDFGRRESGK